MQIKIEGKRDDTSEQLQEEAIAKLMTIDEFRFPGGCAQIGAIRE